MRLLYEPLTDIPVGFTEVEYIASDGNQYIDTGFVMESGKRMTFNGNMMWTQSKGNANFFYGYRSVNSAEYRGDMRAFFVYGASPAGRLAIRYGVNTDNSTNVAVTLNTKFNIEFDGTNLKVNGTTYATLTQAYTPADYKSMWLFNCNCTGYYSSDVSPFVGRIYNFQIFEDNVAVRDFVPCLDSLGVPCMYDRITGQAYYNQGTGTFSYGRKIIPVEYLESSGTQYIDTGYIPTNTTGQYAKMKYTTVDNGVAFGCMISGNRVVGPYYASTATNVGWWCGWGLNEPRTPASAPDTNTIYEMYLNYKNDRTAKVNNTIIDSNLGNISGNYPSLTLFRRNYSGAYAYLSGCVYNYKITEGSNIVRDYIPCKDENNIGYMFDKVTHSAYLNAGTGSFTYGKVLPKKKLRMIKDSNRMLPKGFKEVEYLQANGTQYIDTRYIPTTKNNFVIDFSLNTLNSNCCPFGCATGSLYTEVFLVTEPNGSIIRQVVAINNNTVYNRPYYSWAINVNYHIELTQTNLIINGSVADTFTVGSGTASQSIYLFARNNSGTADFKGNMKIRSFKAYDDGVLVRDFIPCLDASNIPCMYDRVEGKAYYNAGTGSFTYGHTITPMDYIQSSGTQYINTRYAFTDDFSWEIDFDGIQDNTTLFGGRTSSIRTALLYQRVEGGNVTTCPIAGLNGAATPFQLSDLRTGRHTVKMAVNANKGSVWEDGVQLYNETSFTGTYITGTTQALFADNFGSSVSEYTSSKVYALKMWQGINLVRDYIPVKDENNIGYMLDKVTHTLYANAGTGSFIIGNELKDITRFLEGE